MVKVTVDPLTRIEGHMRLSAEVDGNGIIQHAQSGGMLFRGFERMLQGKDPRDSALFVQRICGVCPVSHGLTSINALDQLYGVAQSVPENALAVRNFIQAANKIASHATNIYILWGPDLANPRYRDVLTSSSLGLGKVGENIWKELVGRFAPLTYKLDGKAMPVGSSYINAITAKRQCQEAIAPFGGKMPHVAILYPGGVTCNPGLGDITKAAAVYLKILDFAKNYMLGVDLDTWIQNTMYAKSPAAAVSFVVNHLTELVSKSNGEFTREKGFNDVEFFATFGSELIGEKILGLPVSLRLDKVGTYKDPKTIQFLSYGGNYKRGQDGYEPESPEGERFITSAIVKGDLSRERFDSSKITESIECSFYVDDTPSRHPYDGTTVPVTNPDLIEYEGGLTTKYSWMKAPRYDGIPAEVGALARMLAAKDPLIWGLAETYKSNGMSPASVFTRVLARMQETARLAYMLPEWLFDIDPEKPFKTSLDMAAAKDAKAIGLWEAPRGALGHWIRTDRKGKVQNYQAIVPSTWNLGPRDEYGIPSPVEQALVGNSISGIDNILGADVTNPITIMHVGRSYDPCVACSIHTIDMTGKNAPREYKLL